MVRPGYDIAQDFSFELWSPGEAKELSNLIEEFQQSEDGKKLHYWTILPQPANPHEPEGFYVIFGSPYPVDLKEAKELLDEHDKVIHERMRQRDLAEGRTPIF